MTNKVRNKILECIETALSQGYYLRRGSTEPELGSNSGYSDQFGGVCVLGALCAALDIDLWNYGRHSLTIKFGISIGAIWQLENGFENFNKPYYNSDFYELGTYIANTYR